MNTNIIALLLIPIAFFFNQKQDNFAYTLERNESVRYEILADKLVDIYNKYGKVNIETWDQSAVQIDVHIKVDARNKTKAQETMDRIQIEFSENSRGVKAETQIASKSGFIVLQNDRFQIDYSVKMPKDVYLKLFNKYGNSKVASLSRKVDAEIKYGNIDMEDIDGDLNLMLGYGNATIGRIHDFNAEIKYAGMVSIEQANNANIISKYSTHKLGNMLKVQLESKYSSFIWDELESLENMGKFDDFKINYIEKLEVETKHTKIQCEALAQSLTADLSYSDVKIDQLGAQAKFINFNCSYGGLYIKEINTGFTLDYEGGYSDVKLPRGCDMQVDRHDGNDKEIQASFGNAATSITADLRYSNLNIGAKK